MGEQKQKTLSPTVEPQITFCSALRATFKTKASSQLTG